MKIGSTDKSTAAQTKNLAASRPETPVYEMIDALGGGLNSTGYALVADLATNLKDEGFEASIARVRRDTPEKCTVCLVSIDAKGKVHGLPESVVKALAPKP